MIYFILLNSSLTAREMVIHFLITIFVYMISITIHEFFHAFVAYKCGDPTAKLAGRMTLNPFSHLNLFGFIMFIFLGIGWAKPVPTNPVNFKSYKKGTRAVSVAGVLANFTFGLLATIIYTILLATTGFSSEFLLWIQFILQYIMLVNSFLFMFNILPIPPMDGYNFITTFMKGENKFTKFATYHGFKIFLAFILVGVLTDLFFGFDIFNLYLEVIYNFVYMPITWLGVL